MPTDSAADDGCARQGGKCGRPAVATGTTGCRHEHIITGPICAKHAEFWRAKKGFLRCQPCADLGHLCLIDFKIEEFVAA